ncbi:MAG: HAD-IIB family hydrolase [Streptosporangiales bacterium]|nr:HAD-IIB family hydrolase [Streptosporangiales bacterium]
MPSSPRLVATDLDGTLLRSDGTVSPQTRATLHTLRAAGIDVVFATGRPPRWMPDLLEHVAGAGLAVCSNGALLVDLHRREVRRAAMFTSAQVAEIVHSVSARMPDAAFAVDYGWEFAAQRRYEPIEPHVPVETVAELAARPAVKLLVKYRVMDSDDLLAELSATLDGQATCTHSGIGTGLVEMSVPGVTKATALAELCADRGIDAAEVVAFGDMPNDLPMLAWAGRGYAMANAHPAVLAAVPDRAPANDAEGVARILQDLLEGHELTAPA